MARRVGMPPELVVALADEATPTRYGEGDTIFSPSDTHTFSYVVVGGTARLECRDHRGRAVAIQLVRQDRLFGVSWLPQHKPRAIRAVAHTDVSAFVLDQQSISRLVEKLPDVSRMNLFSYSTRVQSGLVAQKAWMRGSTGAERLLYSLQALVPDFGVPVDAGIMLDVPLSTGDLAILTGVSQDSIGHMLEKVRGRLRRVGGRVVLLPAEREGPACLDAPAYHGIEAEWARPSLGELLHGCSHLRSSERATDFIRTTATLYEVPDGELLLPAGCTDVVAFVVAGSAWLEAAGPADAPAVLQLVPAGHFVRLPTGVSSRGMRMRGRAHRSCVVGLLTPKEMSAAMSLLTVEGQRRLHDVTTRGVSRILCDCTTAPSRAISCRLLSTFGFLAQDFGRRADAGVTIDVALSRADLARFVGVDPSAISRARDQLSGEWISRDRLGRYVLHKWPPGLASPSVPCTYCT